MNLRGQIFPLGKANSAVCPEFFLRELIIARFEQFALRADAKLSFTMVYGGGRDAHDEHLAQGNEHLALENDHLVSLILTTHHSPLTSHHSPIHKELKAR